MKKRKLLLIPLLVLALLASMGVVPVMAGPGSYSADIGKVCWSVPVDITDEEGLSWNPLEVEVSYTGDEATFVITTPVAFNPETWVNDNFWLRFDTDIDGFQDFQVGYMTKEPGETWPDHPTEHWFTKTNGAYELVPDDWAVSHTGLEVFTVTIPVSYLGGPGSNYSFQLGLVKYVHGEDWPWEGWPGDPSGEGWSTGALIYVQLPEGGWESWELETVPAAPTRSPNAFDVFVRFGYDSTRYNGDGALAGSIEVAGKYNDTQYMLEIPEGCVVTGASGRINWLWLSSISGDVLTFALSGGGASFSEPCTLYIAEGGRIYQDHLTGEWLGDGEWVEVGTFTRIVDGKAQLE